MRYPSIRIEGAILSSEILSRLEDLPGQKPADFGLDGGTKVKDEIARAWADAQDFWRIFQRKVENLNPNSNATTETRNLWMVPLLSLLRYEIEYQPRGIELNDKIYAISHRVKNRADTSLQIIGYRDPAGMDKRPTNATRRMSAHALVQELLNLHEQLYGLVTDGHVIRLLRDSSRLIKQSYVEFDLDRIFSENLFADFAIFYRLLHATRLPLSNDTAAESLIELYHQDSLDSGARIREGLSSAVEEALLNFGNGFLGHPDNSSLRNSVSKNSLDPGEFYKHLLRLIYRLLFLMVIEERDLVFPAQTPKNKRDIYTNYYSVHRIRLLSEKRYLADKRRDDLWMALLATFRLFEAEGPGVKLGISPLAGDLFSDQALGPLSNCNLSNDVLLGCLRSLSLYRNPENNQLVRVNYAALNVEEFGSVYEGLLEFEPKFNCDNHKIRFIFEHGDERAATGSHYTPDDLVQPLIKHSLDYLIEDRLKTDDPESALLGLRVADIACGSGHILLSAARRIATELAIFRTGEEQPSPPAYREALRDVIRNCIYGVDLNPLAVELCKVAMWLEAHNPGQPLNFLDHHIKCGNSIVGFAHREDVGKGVPNEAFKTLPGDNKEIAAKWRALNKGERKKQREGALNFNPKIQSRLDSVLKEWKMLSSLPEKSPDQIALKKKRFSEFAQNNDTWLLKQIAAIPLAQFYIPKERIHDQRLISDKEFRHFWSGEKNPSGEATDFAWDVADKKRFFHWFLEFPDVITDGGFDCILGNPPYLGGQSLSGTFSHAFCEYVRWEYAPTGLSELVTYFLRRIYYLLKPEGFTAIITTNSITDGNIRRDGLERVIADGGQINMALRGIKWPGRANLVVSLLAMHKGEWKGPKILDGTSVLTIDSFFEENESLLEATIMKENLHIMYQGSIFRGNGFLISHAEANALINRDGCNRDVIKKIINGKELNNEPDQSPKRSTIDFFDMSEQIASEYKEPFDRVEKLVKPVRMKLSESTAINRDHRQRWWQYAFLRENLYRKIQNLPRCFVAARTTKHLSFSVTPTSYVFSDALYVFTTDRWDLFSVVQSTIHEVWARKYSGKLETRLRYSPSDCFDTFAFPVGLWQNTNHTLASIGEKYHDHRKELMLSLWLGLTKIYNLFHDPDLSPEMVAKVSKKDQGTSEDGYQRILELRRLHIALDNAVLDAYGWRDLSLAHDFYEVEYLPENDRMRYTISPEARREVLKRLLAENHSRAESEVLKPYSKTKGNQEDFKIKDNGSGVLFN